MTRLQEVEKLLDTNLALITEYSKRAAELMGSVRILEKERAKLIKKGTSNGYNHHCSIYDLRLSDMARDSPKA